MEKSRSNHSYKEPIIEFSISFVALIIFIVLLCATGFYWGYLLILIVPLFFVIDGFISLKKIRRYKKQEEKIMDEENKN